ncbi:hypothetical protein Leryth_014985 [Lithospermum erythrorhizon]|nr:hypothetical protein Leryth_014985 [Lithospermum erythrorhizon]
MESLDGNGPKDVMQFGASLSESGKFDASQYAFFSNDVVEEVELGGLDEEEEDIPPAFEDEIYQLGRDKDEGDSCLLDIDDFSNTFSKLNRIHSGPPSDGVVIDRGSREWSSASEQVQEADFPDWSDRSSLPYQSPELVDFKRTYRTSSYPEQQQQQQQLQQLQLQPPHHQYFSEPIGIPKSSLTLYPSSGRRSHEASPNNQFHYPNSQYPPSGHKIPMSSSDLSHFPNHQLQMNAVPSGLQFAGGNMPLMSAAAPPMQSQFVNQNGLLLGDHPSYTNNLLQRRLPHQNGLMPPQLMPQQQSHQPRAQHQFQQSFGQLSGLQPQPLSRQLSPSPSMLNNLGFVSLAELGEERTRTMLQGRHSITNTMHGYDRSSHNNDRGWPRFRSKYMTAYEMENILRMQLAATHSNDPYLEDYYHQARLAKKSAGAKMKHHFCPNNLLDSSSRTRPSNEPHPFLQVDALGRVSFSSIRRPRPLLEVEPPNKSGSIGNEQNLTEKPLEQEPMLAARVTIEDGLCLLLDVDDIDRFLEFNPLHDDGDQLRRRRQVLLEGLASSLQLVDPLGNNSPTVNLDPNVDLVFLKLVHLPKGRKLLTRYLQLLAPGDELVRVVCMAIFRHLRLLFGVVPTDPGAAEMSKLAGTVSNSLCSMDLKALAACLASVVCCAEHPPLRPIGSPAGGLASVILKSLLERATEVLRDPRGVGNCTFPTRAFWQASFNKFFGLLTKYCFNKYDTIMQSFLIQSPADVTAIESDAGKAIAREMPVELLRACLPHTNEQQKKLLLDFAHRSMPVTSINKTASM